MIQFNLLPDVKLQYIRAKRRKRIVIVLATAITAASLTILVLLFVVVNVIQKKHLNDLSKDISSQTNELRNTPDLEKILTVQNQLMNISSLHDKKPVASRLFTYIGQITPNEIKFTKVDINFADKTIKFTGTSANLNNVNKFVDTLKFTNYTVGDEQGDGNKAFSNVVLSNFGRSPTEASYTVDLVYDEAIFDSSKDIHLSVPQTITTRSETEKPLFQKPADTTGGTQ